MDHFVGIVKPLRHRGDWVCALGRHTGTKHAHLPSCLEASRFPLPCSQCTESPQPKRDQTTTMAEIISVNTSYLSPFSKESVSKQ